ncbi:RmlC-like cupin domain-containing protein [Aspergillus pseudotamarii]|uniref:RmlC-like cupin domain-containing protein n=1 Tax=Aspergillus pseudotamarii TaxID=132259 RepID=A0A5N6SVV6_ASPPS|nr:RmlC-like cupin domain-containing protein [Aspergillus pseudotamarii]KAE8137523.1 RmlC-like cupin domain-containing protein [Aspergillus pseudotamarii]
MRLLNYLLSLVPLLQTVSTSGPVAIIARPSPANETSVVLGDTFTGDAYIDASHADNDTWIGNVLFTPSARTHWHTHARGQLLRVIAGSGWICDKGGSPQHLRVGDIAWCPPGVTHWHGAEEGSFLVHEAIAYGATEWLDAVGDEEYRQWKRLAILTGLREFGLEMIGMKEGWFEAL